LCNIMMNQTLSEKTIRLIMHKFTHKEWVYLKFTHDLANIENNILDQIDIPSLSPCLIQLLLDLKKISDSITNS